jgi:hypothetical protein
MQRAGNPILQQSKPTTTVNDNVIFNNNYLRDICKHTERVIQ